MNISLNIPIILAAAQEQQNKLNQTIVELLEFDEDMDNMDEEDINNAFRVCSVPRSIWMHKRFGQFWEKDVAENNEEFFKESRSVSLLLRYTSYSTRRKFSHGCHIEIKPTAAETTDHFNYKGWYSIVLFACVDYRFIYANVGCPGRCNDSLIYRKSDLRQTIADHFLNLS